VTLPQPRNDSKIHFGAAPALYRSDDYPAAAESFSSLDSELAHYNRGNALARAGDLQGAIDAYETVLEFNQDHADAQFNKDLVEQLLEQQEQASQQSSEEDPSEDQNSNDNSRKRLKPTERPILGR
jgi:Ca-activated chloride channel family protein